jgi:hypothetical protein
MVDTILHMLIKITYGTGQMILISLISKINKNDYHRLLCNPSIYMAIYEVKL